MSEEQRNYYDMESFYGAAEEASMLCSCLCQHHFTVCTFELQKLHSVWLSAYAWQLVSVQVLVYQGKDDAWCLLVQDKAT